MIPALVAGLNTAYAGDITGKISLNGTPPPEQPIDAVAQNADCTKMHTTPVKTRVYQVGAANGLQGVVVTLKGVAAQSGEAAAPVVLDQKGCEYWPYILAVQTGQKLTVKNSDPVMHNVHTLPAADLGNEGANKSQMAGAPDVNFTFKKAEPFLKFSCDVHPWMIAYVTVVDNPYFAVTDKDGNFKITGVPAGKYTVQAAHRKANKDKPVTKEIEVKADGSVTADLTIDLPK